jgi:hypothetical protein
MDGRPISLEGQVGPLGQEPGKGTIPLAFSVKAFKEAEIGFKANVIGPSEEAADPPKRLAGSGMNSK